MIYNELYKTICHNTGSPESYYQIIDAIEDRAGKSINKMNAIELDIVETVLRQVYAAIGEGDSHRVLSILGVKV